MLPAPRSLLLASLLFTACAGLVAAATDYEVRLNRASAVGDHYRVVASGTDEQAMTATVDGQPVQSRKEAMAVEMIAECEVMAVTPKGREAQIKLTIEKLWRIDPAQAGELLPPGSIVMAEIAGSRTKFTVSGEPVSRVVAKALETIGVNVRGDDKASDDEIFGATGRKQVGDSWAINSAPAAAELAKMGIPATADKVTGQTTLAEAVQQDGQAALRLTGTMEIKDIAPPLPPGIELQSCLMKSTMSGLFPVDVSKHVLQESTTLSMEVKAGGTQNGRTMEMHMTKKSSRESKMSYK